MGLFIGRRCDEKTSELTSEDVRVKADRLTSHAVCLGMTGSGKTGLCIGLLEELAASGVPLIVIDPKGDMTNLALAFSNLDASEFLPWIDPGAASRAGLEPQALAEKTARKWRDGLAGWGIGPAQVADYAARVQVHVYTPGASAGMPVNMVGSMESPEGVDDEARADLASGTVSGLLGLLGREADPVSSPEHIVLTAILDDAWSKGQSCTLAELLPMLVDPPFAKVGVFPVDTFFPRADRMKLAMALNGVLAAPGFAAWSHGEPLDPDRWLAKGGGRTPVHVFSLAHLDDSERQFFVSQLLHRLVAWSRRQPGSSALRAMLYFDEVFGFAPPYPRNPPTKKPILTLMKQARAIGLGTMLVTQNPVDVDYATLSNAGLWWVGRLHTAQDRAKVVEGLASAGELDAETVSGWLEDLPPRVFVMRDVRESEPIKVHSRWVMSWLRGPMTLAEIRRLRAHAPPSTTAASTPAVDEAPAGPDLPDGWSVTRAVLPQGLDPAWLSPDVAFSARLSEVLGNHAVAARSDKLQLWQPALLAELSLRYDESTTFVEERRETRLYYPMDSLDGVPVTFEAGDLVDGEPEGAFAPLPDALDTAREIAARRKRLVEQLVSTERTTLYKHAGTRLTSRGGEGREAFEARVLEALDDKADAAIAKVKDRAEAKVKRLEDREDKLRRKIEGLKDEARSRSTGEMVGAAETVLSMFFGRRRSLSAAMTRRQQTSRAHRRVSEAEDDLDALAADIEELREDTATEVDEIRADLRDTLSDIEERSVGLERNDVQVLSLRLVWIPICRPL